MEKSLKELRAILEAGRKLSEEEEKIYLTLLNYWREKGSNYPYLHIDPM